MPRTIVLLDPTAPREREGTGTQLRLSGGLAQAVVGFIDNSKPNFNHLADDLADLLTARYGVKQIIRRAKGSASVPASDAVLDELGAHCDLVIAGSGD